MARGQTSLTGSRPGLGDLDVYREQRGEGPPLVLIHGLGGSTAMWQYAVGPLAGRFRVVAYDLRGLGRSETASPPYTMAMLVDDLDRLAGQLALERFSLAGHSLGGAVALAYAAAHPRRAKAVVGVAAPSSTPAEQRSPLAERAAIVRRDGMGAIADLHVEYGLPEAFRRVHPAEVATYRGIIAASDPVGYAALCKLIAELDLTASLGQIRAPVLLVAGELDTIVPAEAVRRTAASIRGSDYVKLEGCGHVVPIERPAHLAELIAEFVTRATTAPEMQ